VNGPRLDGSGADGGVADGGVAQRQRRRLPRHSLESRAQGGVLPAPAFHQRGVFGVLQEVIFDVAALLDRHLAVDERMQIGFLNAGRRLIAAFYFTTRRCAPVRRTPSEGACGRRSSNDNAARARISRATTASRGASAMRAARS